jgi:hypothetical protein
MPVALVALLLAPAAANAAKPAWLPCDPDKLKYKPTITIAEDEGLSVATPQAAPAAPSPEPSGEASPAPPAEPTTYFLNTESSEADDEIQDDRIKKATTGEYVLGLQSLYLNEAGQRRRRIKLDDWSKAKIFGLDHPFPGALAALMRAFSEVKEGEGDRKLEAKAEFLRAMADNPHLRDAWRITRGKTHKIPNAKDEAIAKIFDQVVNNPEIDQQKYLITLAGSHPWFERLPFLDIIAGVEKGYATLTAKSTAPAKYAMPVNIPSLMNKFFRMDSDYVKDGKPLELAVARWRGLFIASTVAALVCKAAEESKNIVALVDADQIPTLKQLLRESFGPSIKVTGGEIEEVKKATAKKAEAKTPEAKTPDAKKPEAAKPSPSPSP